MIKLLLSKHDHTILYVNYREFQVFLSYDCETATVPDEEGTEVAAEGDTYLLRYNWKWHSLFPKLLFRWVAKIQFLLETFFA